MYSTPGISHSSFSIGLVTRSSTSRADAPGIWTKTSTIGTMICGSSSRGSFHTAKAPSSSEPAITSGVSFDPIQAWANLPAGPSATFRLSLADLHPGAVRETLRNREDHLFAGAEAREHLHPVLDLLPGGDQPRAGHAVVGYQDRLQLAAFGDGGRRNRQQRAARRAGTPRARTCPSEGPSAPADRSSRCKRARRHPRRERSRRPAHRACDRRRPG